MKKLKVRNLKTMDIYVFVDNSCVEIFQCEKKNINTINEYLGELEADEIKIRNQSC